jgi:hypothetical protein
MSIVAFVAGAQTGTRYPGSSTDIPEIGTERCPAPFGTRPLLAQLDAVPFARAVCACGPA